jgi:hypothetical protein
MLYLEISMPRTGTPGLSRGLLASLLADSVGLTLVLGHAGVHLPVEQNPSAFPPSIINMFEFCVLDILDDIRADGGTEDGRQGLGSPGGLTLSRGDGDGRAGGHCCRSMSMMRLKSKDFPSSASPVDFFAY